jgi:DNA-binding NtrC family response regulator
VASANDAVRAQFLRDCDLFRGRVQEASGGADALAKLETGQCQVLFLDQYLPDLDAEELRQIIRKRFPDTEVVMLDSTSQTDSACLVNPTWSRWLDKSRDGISLAVATPELERSVACEIPKTGVGEHEEPPLVETEATKSAFESADALAMREACHWRNAPLPEMIGESIAMQRVYRLTRLVARHAVSVLILGETGTGKELVARAVHQLSRRAGGPFIVLNCAAIPETLLESELFGYVRGAFTGAQQSYAGRIQTAQGGTLFLDEVGEMPLSLQAKLLRFLDRREIQRLGSADKLRVDVRVVAATNRDLESMVASGEFRADLYYRLAAFPLELPPLAARREDILPLAHFFLASMTRSSPVPVALSRDAEQSLSERSWGGNVRELEQVLERAVILVDGEPEIRIEHLYFGPSPRMKDTPRFSAAAR